MGRETGSSTRRRSRKAARHCLLEGGGGGACRIHKKTSAITRVFYRPDHGGRLNRLRNVNAAPNLVLLYITNCEVRPCSNQVDAYMSVEAIKPWVRTPTHVWLRPPSVRPIEEAAFSMDCTRYSGIMYGGSPRPPGKLTENECWRQVSKLKGLIADNPSPDNCARIHLRHRPKGRG